MAEKYIDEDINDNIQDEDINDIEEEDSDFDIKIKNSVNKHKVPGTHALKRDTIFLGKLDEKNNPNEEFSSILNIDENFSVENGSQYEYESKYEDYSYNKELTEDVYEILDKKTEIDFLQSRRKPNKETFNNYYKLCLTELSIKYTNVEIFVELSYYFTDNIWNMFKLLNKKYSTMIINELMKKGYLQDVNNINFI